MEGKKLNVLLVEDDEVDVMNVKRAFLKNHLTYPIYHASNGVEALEILRGNKEVKMPSTQRLILLDLNLPKMNGIEFLRELRADVTLKPIPVIVLTTSDEDRDKVEAYNFNVAGYIIKPVTFQNFVKTIATVSQYWELNQLL